LLCSNCGLSLAGADDAAVFICPNCGRAHELSAEGLTSFLPSTAAVTTELAVAGATHYLAVWRLEVAISAAADSAWERIRKVVAPKPAHLYVPSFSLARATVQRLGVGLTEAQPSLELSPGLDSRLVQHHALAAVGADPDGTSDGPGFGVVSPVLVGRRDARTLGHFVYLAVESHEARDLHSVDYELEAMGEELVFIPAVWDPRYAHDSNWRLLLCEFDGLVA